MCFGWFGINMHMTPVNEGKYTVQCMHAKILGANNEHDDDFCI